LKIRDTAAGNSALRALPANNVVNSPSTKDLARAVDLTLWRPEVSRADVESVCAMARQHGVAAVCVNGSRVAQARHLLEGAMDADVKRYEAEAAVDSGAQEVDVVLNVGWLKDGDHACVLRELRDVVEAADERPVKILIETSLLTRAETVLACQLIVESSAQGVAAGTSFRAGVANIDDVKLLREVAGHTVAVKACGTIPDSKTALALMQAGATRLGIEAGRDHIRSLFAGGAAGFQP
jgi:deoxyribose-phosphate aldolase